MQNILDINFYIKNRIETLADLEEMLKKANPASGITVTVCVGAIKEEDDSEHLQPTLSQRFATVEVCWAHEEILLLLIKETEASLKQWVSSGKHYLKNLTASVESGESALSKLKKESK